MKLTATDYKKLRRRKRIKSNRNNKSHLKFLADNCQWYPFPVIFTDEVWIIGIGYVDNSKPYYKRLYRGNHKGNRYQYYKKYANRVVRWCKNKMPDGCGYKKCFDYWWTVD